MKNTQSILFVGKKHDQNCNKALKFIKNNFDDVTSFLGKWGDPIPEEIGYWTGDYIISYLSRWVIPEYLIEKASIAAINFHPASPDYPGIGCNNFALYYDADYYGVTCHHMSRNVDTGDIILTKKFPILKTDNVGTLLDRTYDFQLIIFYEIMEFIIDKKTLPSSNEKWARRPFTRKEFNELFVIDQKMTTDEIKKRKRA